MLALRYTFSSESALDRENLESARNCLIWVLFRANRKSWFRPIRHLADDDSRARRFHGFYYSLFWPHERSSRLVLRDRPIRCDGFLRICHGYMDRRGARGGAKPLHSDLRHSPKQDSTL